MVNIMLYLIKKKKNKARNKNKKLGEKTHYTAVMEQNKDSESERALLPSMFTHTRNLSCDSRFQRRKKVQTVQAYT